VGDSVNELVGAGYDVVIASINFTLPANFETLYLEGTAQIGTGNGLDNYIGGNGLINQLSGGGGNDSLSGGGSGDWLNGAAGDDSLDGGTGQDAMSGGLGNDTYSVDQASDGVVESPGEGHDFVWSYASSYTLAPNVEDLRLGSNAVNGTGNGLANVIKGHVNDNVLSGGGGADTIEGWEGNDTMSGGSGADTFVYTFSSSDTQPLSAGGLQAPLGALDGFDVITDFGPADTLVLRNVHLGDPDATDFGVDSVIDVFADLLGDDTWISFTGDVGNDTQAVDGMIKLEGIGSFHSLDALQAFYDVEIAFVV
jgi:Ca2+-binding RTX toxin-like protein